MSTFTHGLSIVAPLAAALGLVIVALLLWDQFWPRPKVRVHPDILDEERRDLALRPFHLPAAAKGMERRRLDNLVRIGDRRAQ